MGKAFNGLYYLIDEPIQYQLDAIKQHSVSITLQVPQVIQGHPLVTSTNLWYSRLGHIPLSKLKTLPNFPIFVLLKVTFVLLAPWPSLLNYHTLLVFQERPQYLILFTSTFGVLIEF